MTAKVTLQDVFDAGFRAEQFGTPADWDQTTTGYIARRIARAGAWARARFGDGYDGLDPAGIQHERLRAAELCWVSSALWTARAAFIDSNAASSREAMAYMDRREYEASAARAMECALENIALAIGGETAYAATGACVVGIETGPYAAGSA